MRHLEESADDRTLLETMMEEIYLYEEVKDSPMEVPVEPVRQKKPRTIFVRPPTTTPRNAGGIPSSSIPTTSVERGQQTSPVHVAFPCRFTNFNISSTRSRLCKFLGASGAGIAEASITTERIKHLERFILYLIRYGSASVHRCGPPVNGPISTLINRFNELMKTYTDEFLDAANCRPYEEQKKAANEIAEDNAVRKRVALGKIVEGFIDK